MNDMNKIPDPEQTPFLRPRQVADILGVDLKSVLNGVHYGAIPCTKLGRTFLIPSAWVVRIARMEPEPVVVQGSTS
jgi:excisionase family DNA binding protein